MGGAHAKRIAAACGPRARVPLLQGRRELVRSQHPPPPPAPCPLCTNGMHAPRVPPRAHMHGTANGDAHMSHSKQHPHPFLHHLCTNMPPPHMHTRAGAAHCGAHVAQRGAAVRDGRGAGRGAPQHARGHGARAVRHAAAVHQHAGGRGEGLRVVGVSVCCGCWDLVCGVAHTSHARCIPYYVMECELQPAGPPVPNPTPCAPTAFASTPDPWLHPPAPLASLVCVNARMRHTRALMPHSACPSSALLHCACPHAAHQRDLASPRLTLPILLCACRPPCSPSTRSSCIPCRPRAWRAAATRGCQSRPKTATHSRCVPRPPVTRGGACHQLLLRCTVAVPWRWRRARLALWSRW